MLSSIDSQALDLLSTRQALTVRLRRKVSYKRAQNLAEINAPWTSVIPTEPTVDFADAVWWQRPGTLNLNEIGPLPVKTRLYRELEGEILLPKSLKPTFHISHFGIEVNTNLSRQCSINLTTTLVFCRDASLRYYWFRSFYTCAEIPQWSNSRTARGDRNNVSQGSTAYLSFSTRISRTDRPP